ncbi:hypothetical protein O3G_MSEX009952, partial [Manduca sexta]
MCTYPRTWTYHQRWDRRRSL